MDLAGGGRHVRARAEGLRVAHVQVALQHYSFSPKLDVALQCPRFRALSKEEHLERAHANHAPLTLPCASHSFAGLIWSHPDSQALKST